MKRAESEVNEAVKRLGGKSRAFTIKCRKCKHEEPLPAYAIAQLASGHSLNWTCECGAVRPISARAFKRGTP